MNPRGDHAALQRRTLRVLALGQIVGAAGMASAVTVGAFVVQDILGQGTAWAGAATATVTLGAASMAHHLATRMSRLGRRAGLQRGYAFAVVGGCIAAIGAQTGLLVVFLLGLALYGAGQAANLLARYAATDLAAPGERSRAMSTIVFASTFGAVLGPLLIGPAERAGEVWFGVGRYTGPWIFSSLLFLGAMINTAVRLRPDPLLVAIAAAGAPPGGPETRPRGRRAFEPMFRTAGARLAITAIVVSHVTMIAVMAMTPVHLKLHGHEGISQFVVSSHIAGMYAFSPLIGRYSDRRGPRSSIVLGAVMLVAATSLAALSGDVEQLLFPSLWLLGVGWSAGLIGGSTLLIDSVPSSSRVAVQGSADLLMSFFGGLAGFASGFVRRAVGFHLLASGATLAAGALLAVAYGVVRSNGPSDLVREAAAP